MGGSGSLPVSYPFDQGFGAGVGYTEEAGTGGLVRCGNRYYNPYFGRFLTKDPAGVGTNWYAYCNNDPTEFLDPTGLHDFAGAASDSEIIRWYEEQGTLPGTQIQVVTTWSDGKSTTRIITIPNYIPTGPAFADLGKNMIAAYHEQHDMFLGAFLTLGLTQGVKALWFRNKVHKGGEWDYKKYGRPHVKASQHNYDAYGNFNYGATGYALGYSLGFLLDMANSAHKEDNGTDKVNANDNGNSWIIQGFNWAKNQ